MISVQYGLWCPRETVLGDLSLATAAAELVEQAALDITFSVNTTVTTLDGSVPYAIYQSADGDTGDFEQLTAFAEVIVATQRWQRRRKRPDWQFIADRAQKRPIPMLPDRRPTAAETAVYVTGWLLGENVNMPDGDVGETLGRRITDYYEEYANA